MLYALRQEIGDRAFRKLQRAFMEPWLYSTTTPPMPGHADWTSDPVPPAAAAAAARAARPAFRP